jgi:nucleotide-binding universal stress UspA family protein
MKFERVVVGTDFSAPSVEAAQWVAGHFARGAELVLAHVIAIPEVPPIVRGRYPRRDLLIDTVRAGADKKLREMSLSLAAGRVWLEIREGQPVETLTALAEQFSADLIAAGAHGERPGLREGLGSTAEHLVRASARPILLVTHPRGTSPTHILVAMDEPDHTPAALGWVATLHRRFGAHVTAMHVVTSRVSGGAITAAAIVAGAVPVDPHIPHVTTEAPDRWTERVVAAGVARDRVSGEVGVGDAAAEILSAITRLNVDLVIMGRRDKGKLRRAVLGSVVDGVLRGATCPVLVVPE